jgi:hypothetical protein
MLDILKTYEDPSTSTAARLPTAVTPGPTCCRRSTLRAPQGDTTNFLTEIASLF